MLIYLRSDHKNHLKLIMPQSPEVVRDFCKLSLEYLQEGPDLKLYKTVSEKLNTQVENVQNCVYGLVNLLLLGCKHKLSEVDFRDSVLLLGFEQDQQCVLTKFYEAKKTDLAKILDKLRITDVHFDNLEWRFELQVASRSLLHQVVPLVTLDLTLKSFNASQKHLLQTDITNLVHVTQQLEKALTESRSRHSRKVQRALSNN